MSEEVQFALTVTTEQVEEELDKLEASFVRILGYARRLGNENLNKLINLIQGTITTIHSLRLALIALEAASGPIGWLYAGTSMAAAGLSGYSIYESTRGV